MNSKIEDIAGYVVSTHTRKYLVIRRFIKGADGIYYKEVLRKNGTWAVVLDNDCPEECKLELEYEE